MKTVIVNLLTPKLAKTGRDRTTDLLPFVTSSLFIVKDVFRDQLKQKEELFQKMPKWERSQELGQKPIRFDGQN